MTKIEWTDVTWNPVTGCTKVSPGCANCYAERIFPRVNRHKWIMQEGKPETKRPRVFSDVAWHSNRLKAPLHWRKPRRIFVNSMSDLFHEAVPDEFIDRVFIYMMLAPQHQFQILTKRAERMSVYLNGKTRRAGWLDAFDSMTKVTTPTMRRGFPTAAGIMEGLRQGWRGVPGNVWLGVSCEDQKRADERIPLLLQTPAAVRFVSLEPLLGPIDLDCWPETGCPRGWLDEKPGLDWVIVGGESGPKARPCDLAWVRSIRDQCSAAAVPLFVKQLGARPGSRNKSGGWDNYRVGHGEIYIGDRKGSDPSEWPKELRVREYPAGRKR